MLLMVLGNADQHTDAYQEDKMHAFGMPTAVSPLLWHRCSGCSGMWPGKQACAIAECRWKRRTLD